MFVGYSKFTPFKKTAFKNTALMISTAACCLIVFLMMIHFVYEDSWFGVLALRNLRIADFKTVLTIKLFAFTVLLIFSTFVFV